MFFHSPSSLIVFLPIIFFLYPIVEQKSYLGSKIFLLIFSLTFYGFNHPWFVIPLLISSLSDFHISKSLLKNSSNQLKKSLLISASLLVNIGLLIIFKYLPFIEESFSLLSINYPLSLTKNFDLILPAGISFYTFQTLSYVFEVYQGKIKVLPNQVEYLLYVCYFPQLVAGPILRPKEFFKKNSKCRLNSLNAKINSGFRRICFGLFLKLCLADELSKFNDTAFNGDYYFLSTIDAWTMAFGFGLQIYFDFSAYSHLAIGISEMIGLPIKENFSFPYFSKSSTEFWRKWHISLSNWVRDYIYTFLKIKLPLWMNGALPLLLTWGIMGLWHGPSSRFVAWGLMNGFFVLVHRIYKNNFERLTIIQFLSNLFLSRIITLFSIMSTWIYFRANSWNQANFIFFKLWDWDLKLNLRENYYIVVFIFFWFSIVSAIFWANKDSNFIKSITANKFISLIVCTLCLFFASIFIESQESFIYFQF